MFQPTSGRRSPDLWMETRTRSRRFPLCAAVRCPRFRGWEEAVRLHLRDALRNKFNASTRRQWEGGTTGRRPLSASLGSAGALRRHIWDMSSAATGRWVPTEQQFLSSWRFRAQLEEVRGEQLGVNATCQVRFNVRDESTHISFFGN